MEAIKWSYFQYRREHMYPVYIRFRQDELGSKISHLLKEMGFSMLQDAEGKKISLSQLHTRILTIQNASSRLQLQINAKSALDKFGGESLSLQGGVPVYTYRTVALMGLPSSKVLWDLALNPDLTTTDQMVGLRIVLVRFLAQALAETGVLSYWGTVKDGALILMKQNQSFGEAVIIDSQKRMIFSPAGELRLTSSVKIIRKDKEVAHSAHMSREDLISYLSVSTCLLSFTGISPAMKKAIYKLGSEVPGSYSVSASAMNL